MEVQIEYMPNEKIEQLAAKKEMKTYRGSMGAEAFMKIYNDKLFRLALHELINAFSRNLELREDMLQEAWLIISQLPEGMKFERYLEAGRRAAKRCFDKEWRYAERFKEGWEVKKAKERKRIKIFRIKKRLKNNLNPCTK